MTFTTMYSLNNNNNNNSPLQGLEIVNSSTLAATGTAFLYLVLFLIGAYSLVYQAIGDPLPPPVKLLWNTIVYITPPSLVLAFEKTPEGDSTEISYAKSRTLAAKAQAMRRLVGLDGTGILTNVQRTRSLSGLTSIFKSSPSNALPGLGNWDNSCYQNSILQGLSSIPSFYSFLQKVHDISRPESSWVTNDALRYLIEELNSAKNFGTKMWTPPALKNMSSWQQQDAQEYYSKVIDEMEKEITKGLGSQTPTDILGVRNIGLGALNTRSKLESSPETLRPLANTSEESIEERKAQSLPSTLSGSSSTIFRNPLEGLLAQRVGCLKCGFVEGISLIPFNCLTVPLGRKSSYDIQVCLDDYTTLEPINGVECAHCTLLKSQEQLRRLLGEPQDSADNKTARSQQLSEPVKAATEARLEAVEKALSDCDFTEATLAKTCKIPSKNRVNTTKSRQAVIARAPKALVIHINRSIFDEYSGTMSKNYADVRFPKVLDLAPWCLGSRMQESQVEEWIVDPSKSMLKDPASLRGLGAGQESLCTLYDLRAVVTHYGRHENGHYIAYRQTLSHRDAAESTRPENEWWRLSDEDVSAVSEDNVLAQGGVFMLFYERADTTKPGNMSNIVPTLEEHISSPIAATTYNGNIAVSIDKLGRSNSVLEEVHMEADETASAENVATSSTTSSLSPEIANALQPECRAVPSGDGISRLAAPAMKVEIGGQVIEPGLTESNQEKLAGSACNLEVTRNDNNTIACGEIHVGPIKQSERDSGTQFPRVHMRTSSKTKSSKDGLGQIGKGAGLVNPI